MAAVVAGKTSPTHQAAWVSSDLHYIFTINRTGTTVSLKQNPIADIYKTRVIMSPSNYVPNYLLDEG